LPTGPYHIIRFDPLIDNALVLHHLLLYQSATPAPAGFQSCASIPSGAVPIYAWAPGEAPLILPNVTGFLVGNGSNVLYGILQIHYNNPQAITGLTDSSGIRMYLSTHIRQYNAGFLFFGVDTAQISIPAGQPEWTMNGSCPKTATNGIVNPLNVFAVGPHMHLHGKQMWTEHYNSSGARLQDLGGVQTWDFNAQGFTIVEKQINRGDSFITRCIWDTSQSTVTVPGCESTSCEMCLLMVMYYPEVIGASSCFSGTSVGCNFAAPTCCPSCHPNP